jgi:hypothetical protein
VDTVHTFFYQGYPVFPKMPPFTFRLTSIRKKILFLLFLSFVAVIFQLTHVQNRLTVKWQKRDARTFDSVAQLISSYFSKERESAPAGKRTFQNENLQGLDYFGIKISRQEIEVLGDYEIGDKVDLLNGKSQFKANLIKQEASNDGTDEDHIYRQTSAGSQLSQRSYILEKGSRLTNEKVEGTAELIQSFVKGQLNIAEETSSSGFLNLHIWDNICEYKVESLKEFVLFPSSPKFRLFVNRFEANGENLKDIGLRLFGFLQPNESGLYKFGISSRGNSELWLSNDTDPRNLKLLAFIGSEKKRSTSTPRNYEKFPSQISGSVNLVKDERYFVEVLYKHTVGSYGVEVAWMKPRTSYFQVISGSFLSLAVNDSYVANNTVVVEDYQERQRDTSLQGINYMAFMDFMDFEKAFSECEYEPSYYIKKKLVRFQVSSPVR